MFQIETIDGSLAISLLFLCLPSQQLATQSGTPFTHSAPKPPQNRD